MQAPGGIPIPTALPLTGNRGHTAGKLSQHQAAGIEGKLSERRLREVDGVIVCRSPILTLSPPSRSTGTLTDFGFSEVLLTTG